MTTEAIHKRTKESLLKHQDAKRAILSKIQDLQIDLARCQSAIGILEDVIDWSKPTPEAQP